MKNNWEWIVFVDNRISFCGTDQFSECGNRSISAILAMFFTDRKCSNQHKNNGADARGQTEYERIGTASASHRKFIPKRCGLFIRFGWTPVRIAASYYVPCMLRKLTFVQTKLNRHQPKINRTVSSASFSHFVLLIFVVFRSSFHCRKMIIPLIWMQNITEPLPVNRIRFHRIFSQKTNQRFHI